MPAQLIRASALYRGAPYAYAAVAPPGSLMFTAGARLTDVLKTTVYVASGDRRDLLSVWHGVATAFGAHDAPSTLLGINLCEMNT